ncbi:MAG: hypothetical protein U0V70_03690 [Terriglobia bacterium]
MTCHRTKPTTSSIRIRRGYLRMKCPNPPLALRVIPSGGGKFQLPWSMIPAITMMPLETFSGLEMVSIYEDDGIDSASRNSPSDKAQAALGW